MSDEADPTAFLKEHPQELQPLNGWGCVHTNLRDNTLAVDVSLKFQKLALLR
jgi:hypothetical protein